MAVVMPDVLFASWANMTSHTKRIIADLLELAADSFARRDVHDYEMDATVENAAFIITAESYVFGKRLAEPKIRRDANKIIGKHYVLMLYAANLLEVEARMGERGLKEDVAAPDAQR